VEIKRLQVDLTEKEQAEMDRLSATAGLKTKREFVLNALTLFRWVANELASGRMVGSFAPGGTSLKQLEMPCLMPFAEIAAEYARNWPTDKEILTRATRKGVSPAEAIAMLSLGKEGDIDDPNGGVLSGSAGGST
jgi:hypothetical protein